MVPRHPSHASLRYAAPPSQPSQRLYLLGVTANKRNKEQRAGTCGGIDLILRWPSWEISGWRVWEIKCGKEPLLNGSNYRLSATLRQRTGLDLALVDACSCYTCSTGRHHKDGANGRAQRNRDSCLTTCPRSMSDCEPTIQQLVAGDRALEEVTRPGHSPYSSLAKGIA